MMSEYISREAAVNALSRGEGCGSVCRKAIERIPAADVRPVVHGRWEQIGKLRDGYDADHDYLYQCSACRMPDIHNEKVEVPYCWHCGATMDLEEDV